MSRLVRILATVALLAGLPHADAAAESGRGRHKRVFAVPAPEAVRIDGSLADWDLSSRITVYVLPQTRESQSADFSLMYDEEALYIGARVRDPNPMMNRHDPKVEPNRGWDADACQVRLALDPALPFPLRLSKGDKHDQVVHMTLWYYTDAKQPVLQMQYGFYENPQRWPTGIVPEDTYRAAYRKGEDGRSYVFEYRIPWETLGAKSPPQGGDLVAGTAQFNWSRPDGRKTAGGSAWAYDILSGSGFPYQQAKCWGKIIFSEEGDLPRELVEEGVPPEKPLPATFEFDLPEAGEVTLALYNEEGTMVRQIITADKRNAGQVIERWDGLDDLGRPLPAGTYTWKGLYHDGIELQFRLSVHNSGDPPYKTGGATNAWGANHGTPLEACAVAGGMLLSWRVTEGASGIIRTDLAGRKQWGITHSARHLAAGPKRFYAAGGSGWSGAGGIRVYDLKDGRRLNYADGSGMLRPEAGEAEGEPEVSGLAWADGKLYASYASLDRIVRYDLDAVAEDAAWPVEAPGRLALTETGSIVALSGDRVVKLTDGEVTELVADHLDEPIGLTLDAEGAIYVSNRGALQNVSVFAPDGTYRTSIGKPGGRPEIGAWVPEGMLNPTGLDVDEEARLWVAEDLKTPKRISVWQTTDGSLVDDFFGASSYSTNATMDPADITRVYCHGVQWRVDVDKGTWEPEAVVAPRTWKEMRVFTAANGRQYATAKSGGGLKLMIRDGDRFRTVAGVHSRSAFRDRPWYQAREEKAIEEENLKGHRLRRWQRANLVWSDTNRDGIAQEEEVAPSPLQRPSWVDRELAIYSHSGFHYVNGGRLPAQTVGANGVPIYDVEAATIYGPGRMDPVKVNDCLGDPEERAVYLLGGPVPLDDDSYPRLTRFTFDGERVWGYWRIHPKWKRALNLPLAEKGTAIGTVSFLGKAGKYLAAKTYFGSAHIWNSDGLYIDDIFKQGRTGASGAEVIGCEWVHGGSFVKTTKEGRYFVLAGDQDGRVNEVMGLDTVRPLAGGTYTLTPEQHEEIVAAQKRYQARKAQTQKLVVVRERASLESTPGVLKKVDADRAFRAKAAYDAENLYLAYEVQSPHGLQNAEREPSIVFSGGNCIDLQMAADPDAPADREAPAPGDLRLVVTRQDGEPLAVLYRPVVEDFAGEPTVLTSPVDREPFDRIEVVSDRVGLEYEPTDDGFRAVVTVPLALLGWQPSPGITRMDVGYIFGNEAGTDTALRAYWANNSPEAHVTDDIPDESRLNPEHWGQAVVE